MGHVAAVASSSRVTLDQPRAPKVSQVDADELDEGLSQMLGERVERAVGNFKVCLLLLIMQVY
jgi:peroxin-2